MNIYLAIEGPQCVGKSTLAEYLSNKLEIPIYWNYYVHQTNQYDDESFSKIWDYPMMSYYEHVLASKLYRYNCSIILDRSVPSWCHFNKAPFHFHDEWIKDFGKWDLARVIFVDTSRENIERNALKKGKEQNDWDPIIVSQKDEFNDMALLIPEEYRMDVFVENYNISWMEKVHSCLIESLVCLQRGRE